MVSLFLYSIIYDDNLTYHPGSKVHIKLLAGPVCVALTIVLIVRKAAVDIYEWFCNSASEVFRVSQKWLTHELNVFG